MWCSENYNLDINMYPAGPNKNTGKYCIANNTGTVQRGVVWLGDGTHLDIELLPEEIRWYF